MFIKKSRYYNQETIDSQDSKGRTVQAIKLRYLPYTTGADYTVKSGNQLDVMARDNFKDGTLFWHIADANTELQANELLNVVGWIINLPKSE